MVQAEDELERLGVVQNRLVGIGWVLRRDGEAGVVGFHELGRNALAVSIAEMPARRNSFTSRSWRV